MKHFVWLSNLLGENENTEDKVKKLLVRFKIKGQNELIIGC